MSTTQSSLPGSGRRRRHEQVAALLRDELMVSRWRVGERLPSTRELARHFRASLETVRLAIQELGNEGLVTSRRGAGVWVSARPIGPGQTRLTKLAVIVPNRQYFGRAIDGIAAAAAVHDITVRPALSDYDKDREIRLVEQAVRSGADAIILAPVRHPTKDTPLWHGLLADLTIPVVLIERHPPEDETSTVSHVLSDVHRGTRDAMEHLIGHGRRRIGLLAPDISSLWPGVIDGFVEALHHAGLPLIPDLVITGARQDNQAAEFADRCIEHGADAAFVTHEQIALELLGALSRRQVVVPDALSVMEFCDRQAAAAPIPLSGIAQARYEVGAMAVHLLVQRFEAGDDATCHVAYRPRLVLRTSCGCPPATPGSNPPKETPWPSSPPHSPGNEPSQQ